jgi:hypothetical protein
MPAGRAFVHLSSTEEEARSVGGRHTDYPVLVRVDTKAATDLGLKFHQATELIWLCPALPAAVCAVPEDLPAADAPPPPPPAMRPPRPVEHVSPPVSPPRSNVQRVESDADGEFKPRTRKKGSRRH